MDFSTIFTPASIAVHWSEVASNRIPYIGANYFPAQKKAGLDLKWIKGQNGLPISLMPSAFDAKATFRDRIGVAKVETEMPFFREGFKIKEKDRQDILRATDSNDPYAVAVINALYKDAEQLIQAAEVVSERERMALLFPVGGDMQIVFKANGVDYTYNYDPNSTWKTNNYKALSGNKLWSAVATADPIADLIERKQAIESLTGATLRYAVMNSTTANAMYATDAIKDRWLATNGRALGYIVPAEAKAVAEATTELVIVVYDKQYKDESGTAQKFVPDGYVSMLPAGPVGNTWYGTTPEEADLREKCVIVNTGVAITQIKDEHPVNLNTFASEIVLPSFEGMDDVAVLKVL